MNRTKSALLELTEILLLALVLYGVITFALQTVRVVGESMEPTLQNQDLLISTRFDYRLHSPQRGDIVILKDPYDNSQDFIKRVIAVPGDRLEIRHGVVYINGQRQNETYLPKTEPWTWNADMASTVIPPGQYFVMGDNRNHSTDSRVFNTIATDQIVARAWIRIWPFDHFGPVSSSPTLFASQQAA